MTMLSLYIRVQVNILGRHLYIDTARGPGSSYLLVRMIPSIVKSSEIVNLLLLNVTECYKSGLSVLMKFVLMPKNISEALLYLPLCYALPVVQNSLNCYSMGRWAALIKTNR